ncbi:sigma-70 family RNA polymerase sigma factor [Stackebrandtia nassauensis]|uniref:RNA polymerase, sigma-24 subunit, ECF subfamily n=1 Tax=Stackebrandtia nassauensis (strain DSM 44728 / CIP 108903 / NRRL B-16338 / NBRC 102104 / LLR-40K-21) TaxID=446470 RepID=D3Q5U5_STANL|nr:sigma-70 family RNA polymerase sigma factor [Stackebrandtia nassauensis]ADD40244.1 RNA polymerase, sigma-24 subunit, ECF subfamily [Stackebrandtia nassauensis DSM 44728]
MNDPTQQFEPHRRELTGYCYRMLGSAFEAEDAVQETMVRAWKNFDRFEGRSSVRSWLYRIAGNVCFDMLRSPQRRARPSDLTGPSTADDMPGPPLSESTWIGPIPDSLVAADPADRAVTKDSVKLAFIAALQKLPAKQRAVLVLREVLDWSAAETAELLELSVASVNSALQRARATVADLDEGVTDDRDPLDKDQQELLDNYVSAFEAYDLDALTHLLHEDATLSMPPLDLWLRGADQIRAWFLGTGCGCRGSKLVPVAANGVPTFAQYRPSEDPEVWKPWALILLDIRDGQIVAQNNFLDVERLFPLFGLAMEYRLPKATA